MTQSRASIIPGSRQASIGQRGLRLFRAYGRVPSLHLERGKGLWPQNKKKDLSFGIGGAGVDPTVLPPLRLPRRGQPHQEAAPSDPSQGSGIPVTFSSFVISLGSSSLMLMGEQLDPQQPPMPPNLPQAKDIIDLLSVLEDKTKGNLTTEEQAVLRDMLYALRMKYVSLAAK